MKPTLIFKTDNKNVKKPTDVKNGVFLIYAPKKFTIKPMQFIRNDTEVTVTLPKEHKDYFTSEFRHDEIETITDLQQRIWIGILNKSLSENIKIHKSKRFGFLYLNQAQILVSNMKWQRRKTGQKQQQAEKNIEKEELNLVVS